MYQIKTSKNNKIVNYIISVLKVLSKLIDTGVSLIISYNNV